MGAREGSRALQQARFAAGLTQEQLGERAGVSERTVRTLESGRAVRPHRSTLVALAAAVGLDGTAALHLVQAWRRGARSLDDYFEMVPTERGLREALDRQRQVISERAVSARVVIGADRRWVRLTIRRDFEVVGEDVDTFLFGTSLPRGQSSWELLPDLVRNADAIDSLDVGDAGARAILLSLGAKHQPGDTSFVEYGVRYGPASHPDSPLDCESLFGLPASVAALVQDVSFHPDALPARVWRVGQDTIDGPPVSGKAVRLSPFGAAHVLEAPVTGAVHGIRWEWD